MWWLLLASCALFRPDTELEDTSFYWAGCDTATMPCPCEVDVDEDGWCAGSPDARGYDCDDYNPDVHPRAEEVCNGIDDNCADGVDEGMLDSDGDGLCDEIDPEP